MLMTDSKQGNNSNAIGYVATTTSKIINDNLHGFVPNKGLTLNNGMKVINCVHFEESSPFVIRITEDNSLWAIGFQNGNIGVYPGLDKCPSTIGCITKTVDLIPEGETLAVTDIRFFHQRKKAIPSIMVAVYASGFVRVWDYGIVNDIHQLKCENREKSLKIEAHESNKDPQFNTILCCSLSYDNKRVVTGGSDSVLRVYIAETLKITTICQSTLGRDKMDGHVMTVCAVKYHPMGEKHREYNHVFLSGGWDDAIMIWDDRNGSSLFQYHGTHICGNDALDIICYPNMIIGGNWSRDTPLFHIYEFNAKSLSHADTASMNPSAKYIRKESDADRECKPVYSLTQNSITAPTMPYVALWLNKNLIIAAGGNNNCFNIINWKETNICAAVKDFDSAIYSVAFKKPASNHPLVIAFATGPYVYVMEFGNDISGISNGNSLKTIKGLTSKKGSTH